MTTAILMTIATSPMWGFFLFALACNSRGNN